MEQVMLRYAELTPAYGRNPKKKADVIADFESNKDFEGDYSIGFRLINKEQIAPGSTVNLRYKSNTLVTVVKVR